MNSRKPLSLARVVFFGLALFASSLAVFAQEDTDPNSPTPILLSEEASTRALTADPTAARRKTTTSARGAQAFPYNSKVNVYVTNLDLLPDEGANAFRAYIETSGGRQYKVPVVDIQPLPDSQWIYRMTILLRDEIGYWEAPAQNGDVLLNITWRGLESNQVLLGLGATGGNFPAQMKNQPTPFSRFASKPIAANQETNLVGYRWSGDRMRFLEQAAFGATPALDARVRRIGLRVWLAEQLDAPYPSANNPYPNIPLKSTDAANVTNGCGAFTNPSVEYSACIRDFYSMYPLQTWFFKEAFYGDAQLRHRVAWALNEFWVTANPDIQQSSHMVAYNQVLSKNALGNYRTLMKEVTLNPAMGEYLDMTRSTKNNPNENYAREILQLFTIGLVMLNQDGTPKLDAQGNQIPTYDQTTVNNFTKVMTGWSRCENTALCPNRSTAGPNYIDPMLLTQTNHDVTAKTLLSYPNAVNPNIAANLNGNTELDLALDNIFYHPNVAPFVSKILIQHLVTSDPTPAYVGRISAVFNNNGAGVRGDLKAVIRAILLDREARGDAKTDANYGKLREPVQLLTNIFRAFNVRSADGTQPSDGNVNGLTAAMLQDTFRAPTVFNYYAPGYIIPNTTINGPEFGIMTTGSAISRANFVNTMVFSRIAVSANSPLGTSLDFSEMQALAAADTSSNQLLDALNYKMMHGTMSAQMKSTIITSVNAVAATNPLARAQQAIYLVATSSQYQVQR